VFQSNGISLHVEDHGSGKPVVLLHGCSPLSRCVTDACRLEPLFSRAQVLAPAKRTDGTLFLFCERQEMRMKHDESAEFPGCNGG
jgi:hypothetical protein